jgi:hypothetical protein
MKEVGHENKRETCKYPKSRRRWEDDIIMDPRGNRVARCGLDSIGSGEGPVTGSCEHDNKPSGSVKGGEFLDKLRHCQLLNKKSTPWS